MLTVVIDMKTIGSKVEDDIYAVFRLVCEKDGVTVSDRVRELVNDFVKEEAPYIALGQDVSEKLKQIANEKGVDWRELTCAIIQKFCEKCSGEESSTIVKESQVEKAPTDEEKPRSIVDILTEGE